MSSDVAILRRKTAGMRVSLNLTFTSIQDGARSYLDIYCRDFIELYDQALKAIDIDLQKMEQNSDSARRLHVMIDDTEDSIDFINEISRRCYDSSFREILDGVIADAFNTSGFLTRFRNTEDLEESDEFLILHAERLRKDSSVIPEFIELLRSRAPAGAKLERLIPGSETLAVDELKSDDIRSFLRDGGNVDPFAESRAHRYVDGEFLPIKLDYIRPVEDFFGYLGVRRNFEDHFDGFMRGEHNIPLLVSSLPGLGKTHFCIAYALQRPEITLILPDPKDLELGLQRLINKLAVRQGRRFVIFFDDIDPTVVDWYYFRTHIGGSIALPQNICLALASNYEFPANISSRGLGVTFPVFDELRCMEMIEEFLYSMGLKTPRENLIVAMAADYVEQFGQHHYEELSPRTLMRYLDIYKRDREKRRRMLETSSRDMVVKPDPQAFYLFNIKLMKAIHGPDIVNVLQEERLKKDLGII